jgi:dipeptidyl aminopeptidase/acylaminoacyl peptidase
MSATTAGYVVLFINHRASTGYGDAFSTRITGDWGNLDYADLMAGVDDAIAQGLVDQERMGVCGLSGGGNLSCWIVGQTDRFKAAVPENPITNWVSFYGVSDIGPYVAVRQLGGHPHEIPEVYARCSPITYTHRCTTPTLLIQGEADYRCPPEQSEQFYTVLKANGCPVEMLRLPNSDHTGSMTGAARVDAALCVNIIVRRVLPRGSSEGGRLAFYRLRSTWRDGVPMAQSAARCNALRFLSVGLCVTLV